MFNSSRWIRTLKNKLRPGARSLTKAERAKLRLRRQRYVQILGVAFGSFVLWKIFGKVSEFIEPEIQLEEGQEKEKIVVLGSGFGALGFVDGLNTKKFDVTVVSPRGYFMFTPELAKGVTGATDIESIVKPVRTFKSNGEFKYFEAFADDVDIKDNKVHCKPVSPVGTPFDIDYDYLVVAVGGYNKTYDVEGIEHVKFLKSLEDARRIRTNIVEAFETASLPNIDDEVKKRLLHVVVVGGGPVAMETAKEVHEFVQQKVQKEHPELKEFVKVSIIPYTDHVHNYYDHAISKYVSKDTKREGIIHIPHSSVVKVTPTTITIRDNKENTTVTPYGTCIWATGVSLHPFAKKIASNFKNIQNNELGLVVNPYLRVEGAKNIFAAGDCATISGKGLVDKYERLFEENDANKDGTIDKEEFNKMCKKLGKKYPALLDLKSRADYIFKNVDIDGSYALSIEEFKLALETLDKSLTRYPTSASTATQQGYFLAKYFNSGEHKNETTELQFRYKHIGGYEYVGAEDGLVKRGSKGGFIFNGPGARWMWVNIFFSSLVSFPMKAQIFSNRVWTAVFGRATTKY